MYFGEVFFNYTTMKKSILSLLFSLVVFSGISQISTTEFKYQPIESQENKIDSLINEYIQLDIFSGVVLLSKNNEVKFEKAFGYANRELGILNNQQTKFNIGSMNKTFTAVIIYQLIEENKIHFDDTLGRYLSGFPETSARNVTVKQLLNHTSGYGDYHIPGYFKLPASDKTLQGAITIIKSLPLLFEPGTGEEYSNAGYVLLGGIIEKVTGISYAENVQKRIIIPLQLVNTITDKIPDDYNCAVGYLKTPSGQWVDNRFMRQVPKPDGGFISTAFDIQKFYSAYIYTDKLISDKMKAQLSYFNQLADLKKQGRATVHAGGFNGANTVIYEIPSEKISIVVFANMDEPVAEQLGLGILQILRGNIPEPPTLPIPQKVYAAWKQNGTEYVRINFDSLTENFDAFGPKASILNMIGYDLLNAGDINSAIEILQLNTELFPENANCYDSLGEAWYLKGDSQMALKNYKIALELDPEMESAQQMIKKLEE